MDRVVIEPLPWPENPDHLGLTGFLDINRKVDMVSKMGKSKRARRSFTDEFKAGAVRLVLEEGKTVAQVARDLDLTESALGGWVK